MTSDHLHPLEPLYGLSSSPSDDAVENALRATSARLPGVDAFRRETLRQAAIARLKTLGVAGPGQRVAIAWRSVGAHDAPMGEPGAGQGSTILLKDPEPWPSPVLGDALVADLVAAVRRFVVLPRAAADAIALWVLFAHAYDRFDISPILAVVSPVMRCGKSTLLSVLCRLVPRVLMAANITTAGLFRTVEKYRPTLVIDEADTFLRASDEMRGLLNAGHTRATGQVVRVVGDAHEPRVFSTWCPKAIALIGKLPPTLHDRAIVIAMKRRVASEQVERFREAKLAGLGVLSRQAARWAADHGADLGQADPEVPEELDDRAQDNVRPLLAIADNVGGEWPRRAREAVSSLAGVAVRQEDATALQLLSDVRQIFTERSATKLSSVEIVAALIGITERPWGSMGRRGNPLDQRHLAALLKPFGIGPKTIRFSDGSLSKGYGVSSFEEAWARYVPLDPLQAEQSSDSAAVEGKIDPQQDGAVTDPESALGTDKRKLVTDVTDRNRKFGRHFVAWDLIKD